MNRIAVVPLVAAALAATAPAFATPSSTFWAPSTPYVQPCGVLSGTGLQAEVGFDLLYPTDAGGYYGLNETLFRSSEGDANQAGAMASWTSNSLACPGVDHLNLCWDVQTGEKVVGATGGGVYVWFTPKIDLILGPVFFFDEALQPGGSNWMWSLQFDADVSF